MRRRTAAVVFGGLQSEMMGDGIQAALDVDTGSLLNLPGEILRKIANDRIGALKGDAAQGIEHVLAVLLWDAGENVGDHISKDVRHMRCSEFDDLNWYRGVRLIPICLDPLPSVIGNAMVRGRDQFARLPCAFKNHAGRGFL
jgi:hypothetical protein